VHSSSQKPISELRSTEHHLPHVRSDEYALPLQPGKPTLDLPTPEAKLTYMAGYIRDCLSVLTPRSPSQILTGPDTKHLCWPRPMN